MLGHVSHLAVAKSLEPKIEVGELQASCAWAEKAISYQ